MARHDDDDDAFGPDGILRDGKSVRVSLMMRDAAMADSMQRDAARRLGLNLALHKPGPRYSTDQAGLDAKAQAYADSVAELTTAWQRKPTEDLSGEFQGARPGDQCTINGAAGHLNHRLECVPDKRQDSVPRSMTADAAKAILDAAYKESVLREENEWRRPAR